MPDVNPIGTQVSTVELDKTKERDSSNLVEDKAVDDQPLLEQKRAPSIRISALQKERITLLHKHSQLFGTMALSH